MKKYLFPFLAIAIGLYPVIYLAKGNQFGILQLKADLWAEWTYQTGFYAHIVFGGIAMLLGWGQFMSNWRLKYPAWHRNMGKGYVAAVMPASVAGIYLSFYAEGGMVASAGFFLLGWIFLLTTLWAYRSARKGDFSTHERWMVYSYAACFAAVTLRLWMPVLMLLFGDFIPAYQTVAWLCWGPNMVFAWWVSSRQQTGIKSSPPSSKTNPGHPPE
jgi:uncharacterized membrane protein